MAAFDAKLVELAGCNWLASQLQSAGIEVARPERDRGVDLIAYIDRDHRVPKFIACPIQMKAATKEVFSINAKYASFPGLLLVYVWNLGDSTATKSYALTDEEALAVAAEMGWSETDSRRIHGSYSTTQPSKRLRALLARFEMKADNWFSRISGSK